MNKKTDRVRLEIITNDAGQDTTRIEGYENEVVLAWMKLTVKVARSVGVSHWGLLALGAKMGPELEEAMRCAEGCTIDLSERGKRRGGT